MRQARHRWKAVKWVALAAFCLPAPQRGALAESDGGLRGAILTQGTAIQPAVSAPGPQAQVTGTGSGCPAGTFKPLFKAGCAKPSADSKLPADDREPMKFEAIQLSKSVAFLQATGTITRDTPAEFARFLATDAAKSSSDLNIQSPGGDVTAAIELGRAIRKAGLNTAIGRSIPLEGAMRVYRYKEAECAGACAYAFMGGVSRSYAEGARYSLPRSGSSEAAAFADEMGISPGALAAAASGAAKDGSFAVPHERAKEWRVIFDASGLTTFSIGQRGGRTIATFGFTDRGHKYGGAVFCDQGHRMMAISDTEDSIHPVLRIMNEFPVEFEAGGRSIEGTATYMGRSERSYALILFHLPSLDERSFSGSGLVLKRVTNPQLSSSGSAGDGAHRGLLDALSWGDAESTLLFRIAADNGERILPEVLKGCHPR